MASNIIMCKQLKKIREILNFFYLFSFFSHSKTNKPVSYALPISIAPGFELASNEHSAGAPSSRFRATTSWICVPPGFTRRARAACTRWLAWIPPWWWSTTRLRAMAVPAVALEASTLSWAGRGAMSLQVKWRPLSPKTASWVCKTEELQTLNMRIFVKIVLHRLRAFLKKMYSQAHCTYHWCTQVS